jgi:hypothetical protein
LAEGHAKLGQATEANEAAAKAPSCVPSDYLFMHTGLALATGWALAASGCLTHAVATARAAAAQARERFRPTPELVCIQAAAQWGDTSDAVRARIGGGAIVAARHALGRQAESLRANDGDGLLVASAEYLAIGDDATRSLPPLSAHLQRIPGAGHSARTA